MTETAGSLLAGRLLARNTAWNVLGLAAPLVAGLVAVPLLIGVIGTERFGLLTLIWVGVGYFSLFDAGLGRALTKLIAEYLGREDISELRPLIWAGLSAITSLGVGAAAFLMALAGPLVTRVLNVSPEFHGEAIVAFRVLGASLPIVLLSSAMIGVLEAHQRFSVIAAVRIPLGVMTFGAPLLAALVTPSLVWATTSLILVRLFAFFAYARAARSIRPEIVRPCLPELSHLKALLSFGAWLTVTNIVGPIMVYFDRFLIGAIVTMSAVAYYTTPYEVLSRVQLIPHALMGVLFPAFSTAFATAPERIVPMYDRSVTALVSVMTPILIGLFLFAPEALHLWVGSQFARGGSVVARWLAAGWMVNSLARAPFTVLQSTGRPDLVAKTHLAELVPYVAVLWVLTSRFGIEGAAAAWSIRVGVDAVFLNELTRRALPPLARSVWQTYGIGLGLLVLIGLGTTLGSIRGRGLLLGVVVLVSSLLFIHALRGTRGKWSF